MSIKAIEDIRHSVVAIALGQKNEIFGIQALIHIGTGFCIDNTNYFITCKHVLNNTPQAGDGLHALTNADNAGTCNIFAIKGWCPVGKLDLAIFKIDKNTIFCPVVIDDSPSLPDGTDILLYGYPESIVQWTSIFPDPKTNNVPGLANPAMFSRGSKGIISAQYTLNNQFIIEHDIETFPGLSGSPIIRIENNKAVGINEGHRPIGKREEYDGPKFAIKLQPYLSDINDALETLKNK